MNARDPMSDEQERRVREAFTRIDGEERPGFREDLRARLLAQVGPAAQARRHGRFALPEWLRPALAAASILAMLVGGGGLAAGASLPGDALFGLKRAAEELVLTLAPDAGTRLDLLAAQTDARLGELGRASDATTRAHATVEVAAAAERLADALARADAAEVGDRAGRLVGTLHVAVGVLEALEETVPDEAREAIRRAIDSIDLAPAPGTRPPTIDEATAPPERPAPATGAPGGAPVSPGTTGAPEATGAPDATSPGSSAPASGPPSAPQRP